MASGYEERKRLTLEQAEGAEPLPTQLRLREISPELRARLFEAVYRLTRAGLPDLHTRIECSSRRTPPPTR